MSTVLETTYGTEHSTIRIYIMSIVYKTKTYTDEVDNLYNEVSTELGNISGFTWQTFKISRVKNASGTKTEIHLDGCKYSGSDRLNSTQVDTLRSNIITKLNGITNIGSYGNVDLITDRFLDEGSS